MSHQACSCFLVVLLFGTQFIAQTQVKNGDAPPSRNIQSQGACATTSPHNNVQTMLELFKAVEQHDDDKERQMEQPDVKFHWPPSLYGKEAGFTWSETWLLLQPTPVERRMEPRVVAANSDEVVVLFHQRGLSRTGDRFDGEVLGLYKFREGKLARAQMFYFDTAAVSKFLAKALSPELRQRARAVFDRFRSLPPQRGALIERTYEDLWRMTTNQRNVELQSDKFMSKFSGEERDLLIGLLDLTIRVPERTARN